MVGKLIVMRHGQSEWIRKEINRFAGWVDIPLSVVGKEQAHQAGQLIKQFNVKPDIVFTSLLRRSIVTANIVLDELDRLWIPVKRSWRLNERHYGNFQGQTRPAMLSLYGEATFTQYRRSYETAPPKITLESQYWQGNDPRYSQIADDGLDHIKPAEIRSESLKMMQSRFYPYWESQVMPYLKRQQTVLIVTHGSVVRVLIKILENITDHDIQEVNVPTGIPLLYQFDNNPSEGVKVRTPGKYLDPAAAQAGIAHVQELGSSSK